MKQYRCNGCSECCGSTASDRPSQCLFHADSKCPKWELVEQPVRNNYATIQRYAAPVTDWKKAFEMLKDMIVLGQINCADCEADCSNSSPECKETLAKYILSKCTKGGE